MVDAQIVSRGIRDGATIDAFLSVPRHLFVEEALRNQAYSDYPLPIGNEQTISQPYIVALMIENLMLSPDDRVLEIGTGSGYQTAILAKIARRGLFRRKDRRACEKGGWTPQAAWIQ